MNIFRILLVAGCVLTVCAEASEPPPFFSSGRVAGEYEVETPVVRGLLGEGGLAFGLHPLIYTPNDTLLTNTMGLLNYYRVFTTNHRYGESMRMQPNETTITGPDTLRIHWPAASGRPFALTGIYRWVAPDVLDLETIVEAKDLLPDFDVFVASYLSAAFPASEVYVKTADNGTDFVAAEPEHGLWQVFARDAEAVTWVKDGRWTIPPSPVDWAVRPYFAAPLIYRRASDSQLSVVMMARPEDCFAVFTPERGEGHFSMYFSLFGRTLEPGETVRAHIRLVIGMLDNHTLLERYREFLDNF